MNLEHPRHLAGRRALLEQLADECHLVGGQLGVRRRDETQVEMRNRRTS
jgi:hypothetical protein